MSDLSRHGRRATGGLLLAAALFGATLFVAAGRAAAATATASPPAPGAIAAASTRAPVPVDRRRAPGLVVKRISLLEAAEHFAAVHAFSVLVALVLTYLCCHPVFAFCGRGWNIKRRDILSSLGPQSKLIYWQTFLKGDDSREITRTDEAVVEFERMYRWRYGPYRLIQPTILLGLVVATLAVALAETAVSIALGARASTELLSLPLTATAAIAGAYAWVVYGLIKGAERYDLPPSTILGAALRLAIAIPLGYAVSALVSDPLGPFIAFAVGAFPLATLELLLKRLATNRLKLDLLPDSQPDQVKVLDGVDTLTADRLATAAVTTVCELAYCDPVQVSMRTNIAFDAVLNFVNQALAYIYLTTRMNDLRVVGLRGAVEIRHLNEALHRGAPEAPAALSSAIAAANASIDPKSGYLVDAAGLRRVFYEIGADPRTRFLEAVWEANARVGPPSAAPASAVIAPRRYILRPRRSRWP